jgi:GT2 family glycosyltransferase
MAAIVHFGSANIAMTARAAASVLDQAADVELTVIVFDNGSGDVVVSDLQATLDQRVEVRPIPANRGYGAAANVAVELAVERHIELVWLLNNDVLVESGALSGLVAAINSDKTLAAVVPVTIDAGPPALVLGAGVDLSVGRARARHRRTGVVATSLPTGVERVDAIEAAAVLIRVASTRSIGPMDERFFMYWEDTEWSLRARRAGWELAVALDSRVRHLVARSSLPADRAELMIGNRIRFARTVLGRPGNALFAVYMTFWLPAYTVARLRPAFGFRRSLAIAMRAISANVRDARRRRGWIVASWPTAAQVALTPDDLSGPGPTSL